MFTVIMYDFSKFYDGQNLIVPINLLLFMLITKNKPNAYISRVRVRVMVFNATFNNISVI